MHMTRLQSLILISLICFIASCKEKKIQPPSMISIPQFEYVSQVRENGSTKKVNISLDAFYISNEITNKEYRAFTDWAKENPDEMLSKPREVIVKNSSEQGKTRVWTVPYMVSMSDLLPSLIDSDAMFRIDRRFKNYFIDEKFDDYPVVGVSKNAAEFYCTWLIALERQTIVIHKGQRGPDGKKATEKMVTMTSPGYGYYRIPLSMEWEYISRQPYRRKSGNDHKLHKVAEGMPNRWGIFHLHDNVSEWVSAPGDTLAMCLGDNWLSGENSTPILNLQADSSRGYIGFRVARTYKPENINSNTK
jgi:formylglycine-generating enzyme required for sulfatase activity